MEGNTKVRPEKSTNLAEPNNERRPLMPDEYLVLNA
jgi:hypothetical protein